MNSNALALVIIGAFLLAVTMQGNANKLMGALSEEKGFIKFGASLTALVLIKQFFPLGKTGDIIIYAAIIGMFLNISSRGEIQNFINQFKW